MSDSASPNVSPTNLAAGSPPASAASPRRGQRIGTIYNDAPTILIHEDVLDSIVEFSERDLRRETGGFLIGAFGQQPQPHVEVRHFVPAIGARAKVASLTFTHDAWSAARRELEDRYPHDRIVGWHHTHPGIGVFLSGYDLFIQQNFFREPWQIALVVDPVQQEFGFFQWRDGRVVDCGFVCLTA